MDRRKAEEPDMLYLNHFGLNELPFSITPDTEFYLLQKLSGGT